MKKLIAMAAVAAASMVANAGYVLTNCFDDVTPGSRCDEVVFKLTASGKTTVQKETRSGDTYMTVSALKISKGYLVLLPGEEETVDTDEIESTTENEDGTVTTNFVQAATGNCCYDGAIIVAKAKAGGLTFDIATDEMNLSKWSIFGKNLDTALKQTNMKEGSSVSLETELGIDTEESIQSLSDDLFVVRDQDDDEYVLGAMDFHAVAFGTMKYAMSKDTKGSTGCNPTDPTNGCEPVLTWKTYCGWFAGTWGEDDDELFRFSCVTCECGLALFGGTWKAVYQSKLTGANGVNAATRAVFGNDIVYVGADEENDGE